MNSDQLTKVLLGLVVVGLGLVIYSQRSKFLGSSEPQIPEVHKQRLDAEMEKIRQLEKTMGRPVQRPGQPTAVKKKAVKPQKTPEDILDEKSEEVKAGYMEVVKAKMDMPKNFRFIKLDVEDGAEMINGYDDLNDLNLTMMAIPKVIENKEVLPYLDQHQDYLPGTANNPVASIGKPVDLPKPAEGSNLKGGSVWSGKLQDGKEVHIAKLERADGEGSYFFMYTGESKFFQYNDDYFQKMYDSFEALPADGVGQ
ncbi:MAG: hypothetical protein HRT44_05140 [Bdellovibrionales bacterium]|nr:hypothetical protein [Bdellovibrionales bacterium]NQZ18627.1 hypothetical protein [Bdellovibrionales bacterium]